MFNNKPINVEAQRVQKVIQDTTYRLKVLSLLNEEFFSDIRKKDETEVINYFGPYAGKIVWRHQVLEELFSNNCLENKPQTNQVSMVNLEDEETTDEQRKIILELGNSTTKIVRVFSTDPEMYKKLEVWKVPSGEFAVFQETVNSLQLLMDFKLFTPKEEVDQIKKSLKILQTKVQELKESYETKKDGYDRYKEDCSKNKEIRDVNLKNLKEQINSVQAQSEQLAVEAIQMGEKDELTLKEGHQLTMNKLNIDMKKIESNLTKVLKENSLLEKEDRKQFTKTFNEYHQNMKDYDDQMYANVTDNEKHQLEFEETAADLKEMENQLQEKLEAKRKRDEIAAIMKKKQDEQNSKIEKLSRASEWIQAHWRGMLARKEMEKARKGKKKKKKKK